MHVDSGELLRLNSEAYAELAKELKEKSNGVRDDFLRPVPEELQGYADQELGDKESVIVDMSQDTPLVNWAKDQKKAIDAKKEKVKRKQAKKSRRANR